MQKPTSFALALAVTWTLTAAASADAIPFPVPDDGKREVPTRIEIDWGPFRDRVSSRHVVERGETLGTIAKRYYGAKQHWKAIAQANPDAVTAPDRISAGADLLIPPKGAVVAAAAPERFETADGTPLAAHYDAFWVEDWTRRAWIAEPAVPGAFPDRYRGGGRIWLVPHAAARSVPRQGRSTPPASVLEARIELRVWPGSQRVKQASHVHTIWFRYAVTGVAGQVAQTTVTRTPVDDAGEPVLAARGAGPVSGPRLASMAGLRALDISPDPVAEAGDGGSSTWPKRVGVLVAVLGLLVIGSVVLARKWKELATS